MKTRWLCSARHQGLLVYLLIQVQVDLHLALTRVIREVLSGHPFYQELGGRLCASVEMLFTTGH